MHKRIIIIVAVVIVLAAALTGFSISHSHAQTQQRADAVQHAKTLADWQNKVKAWNMAQLQKQQIASTTKQSDLQQQGVSELPDTGASNVIAVTVVGGIAGLTVHQAVLRRRFAR